MVTDFGAVGKTGVVKEIKYYAPGDGRTDANLAGQESQMEGERQFRALCDRLGIKLTRLHPEVAEGYGHGFIQDPKQAREIFSRVNPGDAVAAFLTQWSFNDLTGPYMWEHTGQKLIASNYSGADPGLVGAMGLRSVIAMMTGIENINVLWSSEQFKDQHAVNWMGEFVRTGSIDHSGLRGYKQKYDPDTYKDFGPAIELGRRLAADFRSNPRILGVLDPCCMGMLNAYLNHRDLEGSGVRLDVKTQAELIARMHQIPEDEARGYMKWKTDRGYDLQVGDDKKEEITDFMVVEAGQMYGAYVRWAAERGWRAGTISFQTGMNPDHSSSDDPEATCNSPSRPPVIVDGSVFREGLSMPLRNEADIGMLLETLFMEEFAEAAGPDMGVRGLVEHMGGDMTLYQELYDPRQWVATGHDVRWSDMMTATQEKPATYKGREIKEMNAHVAAFNLSGNMPAEHTEQGRYRREQSWAGYKARRHAWKYFPEGGICTEGLARSGEQIWARAYMIQGKKYMDLGRCGSINMHPDETERMWSSVSRNWPLDEAVMYGISRDELMAGHMSNHISVMYAPDAVSANVMMIGLAEMATNLGFEVNICGKMAVEESLEYKAKHSIAVEGPGIRKAG
jgi:hypothetical protein